MNLALYRPSFPTSAVDRLFETVFNGHPFNARESISPRVDVYNEEKKLVLEVELPGVLKPDIAVSVEDGVLTLTAEKKPRERKDSDYYLNERSFGKYERTFRLTDDIDPDSVDAHFEGGVLRLEMSRKPGSANRKIEVK
jgi:HSP20 family protein